MLAKVQTFWNPQVWGYGNGETFERMSKLPVTPFQYPHRLTVQNMQPGFALLCGLCLTNLMPI